MPQSPRPTKEAARSESLGSDDTPIFRKAQTLNKPNLGESLEPAALVEEFGVNIRTIQCDINERFAYLPLNKIDGHYRLERACLGKIDLRDVEHFAGRACIRELFPSLYDGALRVIFDDRMQSLQLIKSQHYEDLSGRKVPFCALEKTRVTHRHIRIISPESVQDEMENEVRTALARRPSSRRLGRAPTETLAQSWSRA